MPPQRRRRQLEQATDVRRVRLARAAEWLLGLLLEDVTNSADQVPSGLLLAADGPGEFATANPVAAVDELRHCGHPLIQPQVSRRHDRFREQAELLATALFSALVATTALDPSDIDGATARAARLTVRPLDAGDVLLGRFRVKMANGCEQSLGALALGNDGASPLMRRARYTWLLGPWRLLALVPP